MIKCTDNCTPGNCATAHAQYSDWSLGEAKCERITAGLLRLAATQPHASYLRMTANKAAGIDPYA